MDGSVLVPGRIGALSELTAQSRRSLADQVGVSPVVLSKVESGLRRFTPELAIQLSNTNGIPLEFFTVQDLRTESATPTFRKKTRVRASEERRVVRLGREASRVFAAASMASGYRPFNFPDEEDLRADIEQCAREVRRAGGVPDGDPVPNVVRMVERQGIGVITALESHPSDGHDLSGVSFPTALSDRPLVALAGPMPGAVGRFTIAHEVAHLIWDRDLPAPMTSSRDPRERRAHEFAGAVLLPTAEISARVDERTPLRAFLPIKAEFGASVGAIIMRARALGLISTDRARSLHIQLSSQGWRDPDAEPVEVPVERPLLLQQALRRVSDLTALALARHTALPPEMVLRWIGQVTLMPEGPDGELIDFAAARARRRPETVDLEEEAL